MDDDDVLNPTSLFIILIPLFELLLILSPFTCVDDVLLLDKKYDIGLPNTTSANDLPSNGLHCHPSLQVDILGTGNFNNSLIVG